MISFSCTFCQSPLKVEPKGSNQKVKCPRCLKVVTVPEAVSVGSGTDDEPFEDERSDSSVSDAGGNTMGGVKGGSTDEIASLLAPARGKGEMGWLGPYRVLKVLGKGGMGVVFQAEDPQLGRTVALKVILPKYAANPHARARFIREARAAAKLKHDHIVAIYQVGEDRGVPYQAMEYLEGQPLEQYLRRKQQIPLAEVLRIGRDIANGLAEAHGHGLVHRDIKPANIWLEKKKETSAGLAAVRVKILDFGLARDGKEDTSLTQMGTIIGTPSYMAPEQAKGDAVDHRGDLFSLGCVLYRLATSQLPFKGVNTMAILAALALETPAPPIQLVPDMPQSVSDFILKLLEKDPAARPASAKVVEETLNRLLREAKRASKLDAGTSPVTATIGATIPGDIPVARLAPPSRRWPWVVGAVLLLAAAGLTALAFRPKPEEQAKKQPDPVTPPPRKEPPPQPKPPPPPRPLDPYFTRMQPDRIDLKWAFAEGSKTPREVVGLVRNRSGSLNSFTVSADGRWLVLVSRGAQLDMFDFENDSLRSVPKSWNVVACSFLHGYNMVTLNANGSVARRHPPKFDENVLFEAPAGLAGTALSQGEGAYFVGTARGDVYGFFPGNKDRKAKTEVYKGHVAPIVAVLCRPQARRIITVDDAGGVIVVPFIRASDAAEFDGTPQFPFEARGARQAAMHPHQPVVLVSFASSQSIHRVELESKAGKDAKDGRGAALTPLPELKTGVDVASFAVSPDGRTLATIGKQGLVQVWTYPEHKRWLEVKLPPPASPPPAANGVEGYGPIQFSPDARHLLVGHPQGAVVILRLPTAVTAPEAAPPPKAS